MRVLFFGSRSLTWKHLEPIRHCAAHALLTEDVTLPEFIRRWTTPTIRLSPEEQRHVWQVVPKDSTITLINGDGPPGKERGAIGADKLALYACMTTWWEYPKRRVRWFPPEPKDGETWAQAAGRRNREMVEAKPDKVYCIHTNLDASKGSAMTADMLKQEGIPFWLVTVKPSGEVVSVEVRR